MSRFTNFVARTQSIQNIFFTLRRLRRFMCGFVCFTQTTRANQILAYAIFHVLSTWALLTLCTWLYSLGYIARTHAHTYMYTHMHVHTHTFVYVNMPNWLFFSVLTSLFTPVKCCSFLHNKLQSLEHTWGSPTCLY